MKYLSFLIVTLIIACSVKSESQLSETNEIHISDPIDLVNPLVGSASSHALSNGNTYPAIATPWGMNFWTPQTGKMGDGWAYTYGQIKLEDSSKHINQAHGSMIMVHLPLCLWLAN
jgi:putative alpha-1,2-mannosidase